MNAADRRRLTPVAAIVAVILVALAITLWAGVGSGAHWHDASASAALPLAESTPKPPDVAPLEQYREVWQHPLFSPTRSPEAVGGGENESSGNLQLTGVIMLPGLNMAILHDTSTGKDYRVVEGQPSRHGLALVALHPRSAVVESAGTRLHLMLRPGPAAGAGTSAAEPYGSGEGADDPSAPEDSARQDASAKVSRDGAGEPAAGAESASAEARSRMLRARIEARRRRGPQGSGS